MGRRRHLLVVSALVVYVVTVLALFWPRPYLVALLALPTPFVLGACFGSLRRALVPAVLSAFVGVIVEICAVRGGTWTYVAPGGPWGIPLWVVPVWANFGLALWVVAGALLKKRPRPGAPASALLWTSGGIAAETALFVEWGRFGLPAFLGGLVLAAIALLLARRMETIVFLVAGAVLGTACETIPVACGAWSYVRADLFGIPMWQPLGYGLLATWVAYMVEALLAWQGRSAAPSAADTAS
jgi:hypothetical protein